MNVVSEFELVKASLIQIQRVYPNARVVLLVDSDVAAVLERWQLFADSNTQVRQTVGVYHVERGGLVVSEHLLSFLSTDADWWFKMDPDTCVRHALGSMPDPSYFFGTLQTGIPRPSLQGGCIAGGRAAVRRLLDSGVLQAQELRDYERTWATGNGVLLRRAREHGLVSFDFVHAWACERAGVPLVNHDEIGSKWLRPPRDAQRYAITHPHKHPELFGVSPADESEEREQALALKALLRTTLPEKCTIAVVGQLGNDFTLWRGLTVRTIPVRSDCSMGSPAKKDSEDAARQIRIARRHDTRFLVVPASSRSWFNCCPDFARHIITHYEVIFWQDDLALIFDLERPSLRGPHLDWYRGRRCSGLVAKSSKARTHSDPAGGEESDFV